MPSPVLLSLSHPRAQSQTATWEVHSKPSGGAVVTKSSMPKLQVRNYTNSKTKTEWAASERGNCHVRGAFCANWEILALGSSSWCNADVNLTGTHSPCCQPKPRLPVAATTLKNVCVKFFFFQHWMTCTRLSIFKYLNTSDALLPCFECLLRHRSPLLNDANELIYKTNRLTDLENESMVMK